MKINMTFIRLIMLPILLLAGCGYAEQEATALYDQALTLKSDKNLLEAKAKYEQVVRDYSDTEIAVQAKKDLIELEELLDQMRKKAEADIMAMGNAITLYYLDTSALPKTLDDLVIQPEGITSWLGYLTTIPRDPWDMPYRYKLEDNAYQISSNGADGLPETPDDIKSE